MNIDDEILNFFRKIPGLFVEVWNFKFLTLENNNITIGTLFTGVLFMALGMYFSKRTSQKISSKIKSRIDVDRSAGHIIEVVIFYILLVISTLFALKMANIPITIFTVVGGAFAIGIGFGSQNIINNLFSGIILMVERPIKVGDFLEVDDTFGQVEDIGMRSTRIISTGNKHIILPNSFFLDKKVVNWTHHDKYIRNKVLVGVTYGSDINKVKEILLQVGKNVPQTIKSKGCNVLLVDFGDNAIIFELGFWLTIKELLDSDIIKSDIRFKIHELLEKEGIVIAFPQRDVHLYPQKPIEVQITK